MLYQTTLLQMEFFIEVQIHTRKLTGCQTPEFGALSSWVPFKSAGTCDLSHFGSECNAVQKLLAYTFPPFPLVPEIFCNSRIIKCGTLENQIVELFPLEYHS